MSDQNRGWCPACRRHILLKKDGKLRHHGGPLGSGMWGYGREYRCDGVGQTPMATENGDTE